MNINDFIKTAGNDLNSRDPKYSLAIIRKVSRYIGENVDFSSGKPVIADSVLERIREDLIMGYPHDPLTILCWNCYNQLNWRLSLSCGFLSKYIWTPQQTERLLIVHAGKFPISHLEYIDILAHYLLKLPPPPSKDPHDLEVHYACYFFTAAVIWGNITFPGCDEFLLSLQLGQIYFNPYYLIRGVENSDALRRYFLPYPANLFLNQFLLFSMGELGARGAGKLTLESPAFLFKSFTVKSFPAVYQRWSKPVLEQHYKSKVDGISPDDLRNAVVASSVLSMGDASVGTGPYPSFVTASLSDIVPNFASKNDGLTCLVPGYLPGRKDYVIKKKNIGFIEFQNIPLYKAISKITALRGDLEKYDDWKKMVGQAEKGILETIVEYKSILAPNDFINLDFYGRWIISLLHVFKKMSALSACVSPLAGVLSELSNLGKIVYDLTDYDCVWILIRLTLRHSTPNILSSTNAFLQYVSIERDDSFIAPNLFLLARIYKLDFDKKPTLKPIITCDVLDRALDALMPLSRFTGNPDQHLAYTRRTITKLCFYTGLRVNEGIDLKRTDVLEDNGIMLYVRDGKTINAERYLPLSLLLPASFLTEFNDYLAYRWSLDCQSDYLFVNSAYHKLDDKSLTDAVREAFKQQGMADFHFHLLRDAFACWTLMKWFYAVYEHMVPLDTPFRKYDLFSQEAIASFRMLFLGQGEHKEGQESFTYALQILAHLLGHGSANIAIASYIEVVDWIFYLMSSHYEAKAVTMSSRQAEYLLQVSYLTLPPELQGSTKKTVTTQFLLDQQHKRIGRKVPILTK